MLTRRSLIGSVPTLAALGAVSTAATTHDLRAEADAVRRFAERTHPRGVEATHNPDWIRRWTAIRAEAPHYDDASYVLALRRALAWFADGHTTVLPFEFVGGVPEPMQSGPFGLDLPLRTRPFSDGLYVVAAKDEALPLLGARLTRVQGEAIEQLVVRFSAAWPSENPAWGHNWSGLLTDSWGTLKGFAPQRDRAVFEAAGANGLVNASMSPRSGAKHGLTEITRQLTSPEKFAAEFRRGNFVKRLSNALYVGIGSMEDTDGYTFSDLLHEVSDATNDASIGRIIVDLRRNGGGDNYLGEPLRHELARSRFNRAGHLFVLIGPQVFSAGQNLANRLERETMAYFVGEPSGSAPNLHGDPQFFVGPQTGITVMVSTLRWYDGGPTDHRAWIFPDTRTPDLFSDWISGRDRALETALSYADESSDDFGGRSRYFERASQNAAWPVYWRV